MANSLELWILLRDERRLALASIYSMIVEVVFPWREAD
jgi:hypothetical protein